MNFGYAFASVKTFLANEREHVQCQDFKNCISYVFVPLIFEFQLSGIVDVCLYVLGKKG